jgi:hypothetical protein
MEVRNLIKPNATLVQITEIGVGDIYKRLETPSYGEPKIVCGTVTQVLNNGEVASLVAIEFTMEGYGQQVDATIKVFNDKTDVALFPVTVDEFRAYLGKAIERQQKAIEQAERGLQVQRSLLEEMMEQSHAALSIPVVKEIQA